MKDQTKTISRMGYPHLRVELDRDEYYPNDPGAGFPAMVHFETCGDTYSATYDFAAEEEFLQGSETPSDPDYCPILNGASKHDWALTRNQLKWLWSIEPEIDAFLEQE